MSEAFTAADMMGVVLLGLGIVFAVLLIIYIMMVIMRMVLYHPSQEGIRAAEKPQELSEENQISEEEAAAVVTVIAAAMGKSPSSFHMVNLYRR